MDDFIIVLVPTMTGSEPTEQWFNYYLIFLSINQITITMNWWKFAIYTSLSKSYSYSSLLYFSIFFSFSFFQSCYYQKEKGKCNCIFLAHMGYVLRSLYFDLRTLLYSSLIKQQSIPMTPLNQIKLEGDAPFVWL